MKKLLYICLLFLTSQLSAQAFENEIGIKAGYSSGLSLAHYVSRTNLIEIQALYNRHGFQAFGFYKYQFSPYDRKQLYYFVGAGPYGGNWDDEAAAGVSVLFGASYYLRKVPIGFGIEWKPMLNAYKNFDFAIQDISATLKVIIN